MLPLRHTCSPNSFLFHCVSAKTRITDTFHHWMDSISLRLLIYRHWSQALRQILKIKILIKIFHQNFSESLAVSPTSDKSQITCTCGYYGYSPEHLCELALEQRYDDRESNAGGDQVEESRLWTKRQALSSSRLFSNFFGNFELMTLIKS